MPKDYLMTPISHISRSRNAFHHMYFTLRQSTSASPRDDDASRERTGHAAMSGVDLV